MTSPQARFEASTLPTPESISDLTERVMAFLDAHGVEGRATHHAALVLDEILTNLATHGDCANCPARISIIVEPDKVVGAIVDAGTPFDPRLAPDPSLDLDADDRAIGGLGLYLVRKLTCTLEYTRLDGENRTTFAISRGKASSEGESK